MDYIGSKCIVCGEHFKKDDDIVVCPECGTPYHRVCYNKAGACTNTVLHEKNRTWAPEPEQQIAAVKICANCRTLNTASSMYCSGCGAALTQRPIGVYAKIADENAPSPDLNATRPSGYGASPYPEMPQIPFAINFSDPLCGFNPGEEYDNDVKLAELGAYVDSNTHYYLPRFKIMKETKHNISWNFLAFLFPDLFFANRKMPLTALLCIVIKIVTTLPNLMNELYASKKITGGIVAELLSHFDIAGDAFQALVFFTYILRMIFFIGMALSANGIYYRHCLNSIPKVKESASPESTLSELHKKGGTSGILLGLFIFLEAAVYFIYYISVSTSMSL